MITLLAIPLILFLLGGIIYAVFVSYVPFREGYMSGKLIKFSKKGKFIKTWEGQINRGVLSRFDFRFSVTDKQKDLIKKIKEHQGHRVKIVYREDYSALRWRGETKYFITHIEKKKDSFHHDPDSFILHGEKPREE